MNNKLVFATNNAHKLKEVSDILQGKIQLLSLRDVNCSDNIPETADTIEGNAQMKARYVYDKYHINCFADDTGLEVDELGGAPGVYSARYADLKAIYAVQMFGGSLEEFEEERKKVSEEERSKENRQKLLKNLRYRRNRKAQFRTVICLILDGREYLFEGIIKGTITNKEKGKKGFGYDSIFIPEGYDKTFAQLGDEVKNSISHRALAIQKLSDFLLSL